jgi:hypothetical protein
VADMIRSAVDRGLVARRSVFGDCLLQNVRSGRIPNFPVVSWRTGWCVPAEGSSAFINSRPFSPVER